MTMVMGKAEVFTPEKPFNEQSSVELLQQIVKSRTQELPRLYAVFEYNAGTGKHSRSTSPVIDNLITPEAHIAVKEAMKVSEKTNVVYTVIRLNPHQTAPNTIVYDESDDVYAVVIQGKSYRKL